MKKKSKKVQTIIELKCTECGKKTKHYLSKNGDYKCLICGKVNKSLNKKEIVFEADENFFEPKIDMANLEGPDEIEIEEAQ